MSSKNESHNDAAHYAHCSSGSRSHRRRFALLLIALTALTGACTTGAPSQYASDNLHKIMEHSAPLPAQQCTHPDADVLDSIVRVASVDGADASGVVIASDRVLTAAHVVENHYRALVYIAGVYRDALVIATDPSTDLALLAVDTGHLQPIRVSHNTLLIEEPVWTVGFPLALDQKTSSGVYQNHVNGAIYASASTNAGASGGGLLRCGKGDYELAGMIRGYGAYWREGELQRIEDLSISVPAEIIASFALTAGIEL